jgi:diadenosine tetraphosphatase ApaH/serine/threonine PP2A family protein phosphatase
MHQCPLVYVSSPAVIVGDIHGNLPDLLRILRTFPKAGASENIVFLGDYVDRGSHSVGVMILLLALLCKYPKSVTLLRGNHEFSHINRLYGFYDEIMFIYRDKALWDEFQTIFARLPLVAIVDSKIFCVHGGLSPDLTSLDQISGIQFPIFDYQFDPLISDLVWSDPTQRIPGFGENQRGSGVLFGANALKSFLTATGLKLLVRAHQCVADGFLTFADNHGVTLFSSSFYCPIMRNKCGVLSVTAHGKLELYSILQPQEWKSTVPRMVMAIEKPMGMKRIFTCPVYQNPSVREIQTPAAATPPQRPKGQSYARKKAAVCTPTKRSTQTPRMKVLHQSAPLNAIEISAA